MRRSSRARPLLWIGIVLAAASVLILPVFLGPLAMVAAGGAIWGGERFAGTILLFVAAGSMALGMWLGCIVACAR